MEQCVEICTKWHMLANNKLFSLCPKHQSFHPSKFVLASSSYLLVHCVLGNMLSEQGLQLFGGERGGCQTYSPDCPCSLFKKMGGSQLRIL